MPHAATSESLQGLDIPGVEILGELGRGAHSVVYKGKLDEDVVAVKVRKAKPREDDDRGMRRYRREAAVLARFHHPGLASIIEAGELSADGRSYLIMEYVSGPTLDKVIAERGKLEEDRLVDIAITVAGALEQVHRHGVVHRDIKPGNILVRDEDGAIKLIDFGFAARTVDEEQSSSVVGTFKYSAPEQTGMLKRPVDGRADLYSLGVVLYECATGRPPFEADDASELIRLHAVERPASILQQNDRISKGLARIIERLLEKDPDDRYPDCEALLSDLARLDAINTKIEAGETVKLGAAAGLAHREPGTPLFGRGPEYRRLASAWRAAKTGRGSVCWISGEPGMGSTRLAQELEKHIRTGDPHALVFSGGCREDNPTPFGVLRRAGRGAMRDLADLPREDREDIEEHLHKTGVEHMPILARRALAVSDMPEEAAGLVRENATSHARFSEAAADFFIHLATAEHPVVIIIDAVQRIDEASRDVLEQVAGELRQRHVLLVCTLTTGPDVDERPETYLGDTRRISITRLNLGPLSVSAVSELVKAELGGVGLERDVIEQIASRANGSPLAVKEYLHAMLDAGLLRPLKDGWRVDVTGLDHLDLPGGVMDLVLRRVSELSETARDLLVEAAVIGQRFSLDLLRHADGGDALVDAVSEAVSARIIEHVADETYAFLHTRLRESLLSRLDDVTRRANHQKLAESLDGRESSNTRDIYELARHYAAGHVDETPMRVFETNFEAGRVALSDHAFDEAHRFLSTACRVADEYDLSMSPALRTAMGEACAATGRIEDAVGWYEQAVARVDDRVRRARLHARIARVYMAALSADQAAEHVEVGLRELGRSFPSTRLLQFVGTSVAWVFSYVFVAIRFLGWSGRDDERTELLCELYEFGALTAFFQNNAMRMLHMVTRAHAEAARMQPNPARVRSELTYGVLLAMLQRREAAIEHIDDVVVEADALGDPRVAARAHWFDGTVYEFLGDAPRAELMLRDTIRHRGVWLELWEYVTICGELGGLLLDRGFAVEVEEWGQRIIEKTDHVDPGSDIVHLERVYGLSLKACSRAWTGDGIRARELIEDAKDILARSNDRGLGLTSALGYELIVHFECGNYGDELSRVIEDWDELDLRPDRIPHQIRRFYVYKAYARLEQYRRAIRTEKRRTERRLRTALDELEQAAETPKHHLHGYVIRADYEMLRGDFDRAMALLTEGERLADICNSPWGNFEVELRRARLLKETGHHDSARRRARRAHAIAQDYGWEVRARDLQIEFDFFERFDPETPSRSASGTRSASASEGSTDAESLKLQRYLDALLEVSIASGTVFDPREQARVALDEIVRIFGAERAFLFIERDDELELVAGRSVEGHSLSDAESISQHVVRRVGEERAPVVSAGAKESEILQHTDAVEHEIRSLMAVPLAIRDRFLGVVYVDSRVARGVFSWEDVEILMAISSHIAVSQETARAALLEVQVESERQRRELAEVIRQATGAMSSTFEPTEVLDHLLGGVVEAVDAERAMAVMGDQTSIEIVVEKSETDEVASGDALDDPRLQRITQSRSSLMTSSEHHADLHAEAGGSADETWLGVPILARDELVGLIILERTGEAFADHEVQVAMTLAGQAAVALENAKLFEEVQRLATIDELTGIANRRRFFDLASREFKRAKRYGYPLSALMLDIDHFKSVNDQHGHAVGDTVLREVAGVCSDCLREGDILGRYGGEEFVAVLPQTALREAAEKVAERLRRRVAETEVDTDSGIINVTVSVGVVQLGPDDEDVDGLVNRADKALYMAKDGGRNTVVSVPRGG
jgi:diguanylate cyclase (GGDEF)-like protein